MAKDNDGKSAVKARQPEGAAKHAEAATAADSSEGRDWSKTLFLPETEFPMRAGLPDLEPRLLARSTSSPPALAVDSRGPREHGGRWHATEGPLISTGK